MIAIKSVRLEAPAAEARGVAPHAIGAGLVPSIAVRTRLKQPFKVVNRTLIETACAVL
ncbi:MULTISPECIES: hypothetical protein [unclassified Bradyrhizobium]|uniref:hypothetical protein n=1 Tax=unclassified Bradyrhizobium TaxID=2631580 RepID=UPI0024E16A87|nr:MULTISPECIES: hypothetical protein [unclassified Bradyrhizobium]